MSVFRVEKNKGYTVMSNYHLKDKDISLKAKGLLSLMLSLPENWDYTLRGLATINKESIDAIRTAVLELEENGYIIRHQGRDNKGKLTNIEYTIYEQPQDSRPSMEKPLLDNPITDNPTLEEPISDIPTQLNTKESNTNISIKDQSIYQSDPELNVPFENIMMNKMDAYSEIVKENIEYDSLLLRGYDKKLLNEIFSLLLDTVCSSKKQIRIGGEDMSAELVKSRFLKLNQFHIEYVYDCMKKNDTKVYNIRNYLLTTLYNAPNTMNHFYQVEVAHDIHEGISI